MPTLGGHRRHHLHRLGHRARRADERQAGIGFTLANLALIITGALVGSSGAILSYIMCKGMNRGFFSVILGGFGGETAGPSGGGWSSGRSSKARPTTAAFPVKNAGKLIIVPGYCMAVAPAQRLSQIMSGGLVLPQINASTRRRWRHSSITTGCGSRPRSSATARGQPRAMHGRKR